MRIQDAKPGDVLRDKAGDLWFVGSDGAWFLTERGAPIPVPVKTPDYTQEGPDAADEEFGPFARLVPEVTDER